MKINILESNRGLMRTLAKFKKSLLATSSGGPKNNILLRDTLWSLITVIKATRLDK
jgi:hypothetical protein